MVEAGVVVTVAGIVAPFGAAMLFLRINRELEVGALLDRDWLPWADRLLVGATMVSLLGAICPILLLGARPDVILFASRACLGGVLMVAGYMPGIMAHYRLVLGRNRKGPRVNPEPMEAVCVIFSAVLATGVVVHGALMVLTK